MYKITPSGSVSTFATGLYDPYGMGADTFGNIYLGTDVPPDRHAIIMKIGLTGITSTFTSSPLAATDVIVVPEPTSLTLLGLGTACLLIHRRRR
jgi:ribosome biogenesis SPOUT family RNA methylase Rps3